MRPLLVLPVFALSALASACSGAAASGGNPGDSFTPDASEGASTAALVVFERTVSADDAVHTSAVARFIKMRSGAVDEQALRMVGATLDLPALGTCSAPAAIGSASTDLTDSVDGPRAVELLDVGGLAVDAIARDGSAVHTTLEARALPDIVDLVTGVLYSTRSAALDALPGSGEYLVHSTGGAATVDPERTVSSFNLSVTAPGEPGELRVDGQDARAAEGVALKAGQGVELAWSTAATNDPDDLIYVEVGSDDVSVRCLFADHGAATIPASTFVSAGAEVTHGTLVVHRMHRETFQIAAEPGTGRGGIDAGVVRFDFARSAEFSRK